jgi:hypothetical protein
MDNIIRIVDEMDERIRLLGLARKELAPRARAKANCLANYDRAIARTLIQLKNGVPFIINDQEIKDPPASYAEKIARGICAKEKIESEYAEAEYKNAIVGIECIQAELNGLQSQFRHLDSK